MVQSRCGLNAREEIKNMDRLHLVMAKLKVRFLPRGSAIFQQLDQTFSSLTLASCQNVSEFAEKLCKARNDIHELDVSCRISEPHFVNRFLTGLGLEYSTFLSAFYQVNSLIPERNDTGTITREAVTFDTALIAAEKEEQSQKMQTMTTQPLAMAAVGGKRLCTHCHSTTHDRPDCWKLFPDKKAAFAEQRDKRRRIRQKTK
ncbi:hypothetical protein EJ04DRAFT_453355, partial [Polyplosphaeria fusca]